MSAPDMINKLKGEMIFFDFEYGKNRYDDNTYTTGGTIYLEPGFNASTALHELTHAFNDRSRPHLYSYDEDEQRAAVVEEVFQLALDFSKMEEEIDHAKSPQEVFAAAKPWGWLWGAHGHPEEWAVTGNSKVTLSAINYVEANLNGNIKCSRMAKLLSQKTVPYCLILSCEEGGLVSFGGVSVYGSGSRSVNPWFK